MKSHPRLRKALRVTGIVIASLIGFVIVLLGTGALVVRSQWGQKKLLAFALPIINNALTGRVEIGGIGGDIFHRLVLRDIKLYDSEAVLSASVGEAAVRYNLLAIVHKDVHITHAQISDAWVRARYLRDGQINLAALLKPRPPSGPLPVTITVDDAVVDLGAKFDPKQGTSVPPVDAQLHLEAAARIFDPHITADIKKLNLRAHAPLEAQIDLSGGVSVLKGAQPQIEARDLKLRVQTTGEQANRLAPQAALQGNFELALLFHGPLTALGIDGGLRLPKGTIDLHAVVGALDPKLPWQMQINGQGIDPAAARADIPAANIDLRVEGRGQGPEGRVELRKLAVSALGASLNASGFAEGNATEPMGYPLPKGIAAQLMLNASAPDLAAVTRPFAPPSLKLAGAVSADVKVGADKGQLRVDLNVNGNRLQAAGNSVQTLALSLHSVDLFGQLKLHAESVQSPLRLTRLDLDAGMTREALSVRARGIDYRQLVFDLAVAGQPHMDGQKLLSLNAKLNQLFLSRSGQRLDLVAPAAIALDMVHPDGPIVDLGQLALRLNQQRLTVAGHFEAKPKRFRASLDASSINAKQWAQIAGVSGIPRTALNLHAHVSGTPKSPEGQLKLGGSIDALPEQHLPRSELQVAVNLRGQRAQGDVSIKLSPSAPASAGQPAAAAASQSSEPTRATLRFDAPLALTGPLTLNLEAQTPAQAWAELLPEKVRSLRGLVVVQTSLRGSLQEPELALTVKVPSWGLEKLRGIGTALVLSYGHELVSLRLDSELATLPVAQIATLMVRAQTRMKLGLGTGPKPLPTAAELKQQLMRGAMVVDASLLHVDLPKVLAQVAPAQAADPTLLSGRLSATLHVEGTPEAPKVQVKVDTKELAADIPRLRNVAVSVDANYAGSALGVDVTAGLPDQPLLKVHGETDVPMARVLNGTLEPKELPVRAKLDVLPFELSQVSMVRGKVTAQATVKGTVGAPEVSSWVRSQSVQIDNFAVGPLVVNATLNREQLLKANVDLQQKGGLLRLTAQSQVPPRMEAVQLNLTAQNFSVDYNPSPGKIRLKDPLGMVKGVLNADLHMQGTENGPSVRGFLKLEKGGLVMKALQQALGDINVDLQITPPGPGSRRTVIALKEARLNADSGKASIKGTVNLEGTQLSKLSFDVNAQQFPVWAGVIALWIDSRVQISGHVNGDALRVDVHIPDGGVRLPKFQSARSVQALGPFEGVNLVGRKAEQAAARAEKKAEEKAEKQEEKKEKAAQRLAEGKESGFLPANIQVAVQLPDAFHVSGPELRTDLTGHVDLAMGKSGIPRITGQVRNAQGFGWVEILKRRYEIDRIETSLAGENPPNPLFNIEISRKLDETTIYINVSGSARKPKITFRSDPPLLDESQIIATILTGERGSGSGDVQAMGILSSLLIGQLRDQLADRLPIDVLRVDVAGDDPMGVNQSSLEVGKYLRDNVYLGYKRRFGSATTGLRRLNADEVILEYNFFRNYKVKTLYGDANVGAIDLYWTKRF